MQFFHISITFAAQKLEVAAQIEKKVDFITFEHYSQFIRVFLIKKGSFLQEFQNFILANQARKLSQKCTNVKCSIFPHIYIPNGVF